MFMTPRQKETLLIGVSYLEAHHEKNTELLTVILEEIDKDELIYSLTMVNSLIAELLVSKVDNVGSTPLELLQRTREVIETRT